MLRCAIARTTPGAGRYRPCTAMYRHVPPDRISEPGTAAYCQYIPVPEILAGTLLWCYRSCIIQVPTAGRIYIERRVPGTDHSKTFALRHPSPALVILHAHPLPKQHHSSRVTIEPDLTYILSRPQLFIICLCSAEMQINQRRSSPVTDGFFPLVPSLRSSSLGNPSNSFGISPHNLPNLSLLPPRRSPV